MSYIVGYYDLNIGCILNNLVDGFNSQLSRWDGAMNRIEVISRPLHVHKLHEAMLVRS